MADAVLFLHDAIAWACMGVVRVLNRRYIRQLSFFQLFMIINCFQAEVFKQDSFKFPVFIVQNCSMLSTYSLPIIVYVSVFGC